MEMQDSMSQRGLLVVAIPYRLVEIPYPWSDCNPRSRIDLRLILDYYVRKCLHAVFHPQDSELTYEEYERKLAQYLFPEATEKEREAVLVRE